ncbi:hypothetical protein TDB9533_01899 [Thalassocella blandensis]|nr:hypothetical protein TDB9533_01899 [Thalassocella blandensis]
MTTKSLLFYKQPVMLDKVKHKDLKLKKISGYDYAKDVNSVPVSGLEFFNCSRNFPVMFVKNNSEEYIPIAVLSLKTQGHSLGDTWENVYVPSFVRRYPFVLEANQGMVMIDAEAPQLQEEEGEALFQEDGEPTQFLREIMAFLDNCDKSYKLTEAYTKALKEKELLEPFKGVIKFADASLKLDHLHVINEQKMYEALSDADVVEWFKKGWLAWSHAHLHSISAMSELVKRLPKKESTPDPA